VIAGGRGAGSQVACRTAKTLGAHAVVALSYPLLGPGSPHELLSTALPMLVVQGGNDPYGTPDQFPPLPPTISLVEVPFANHTFDVPARTGNRADGAIRSVRLCCVSQALVRYSRAASRATRPVRSGTTHSTVTAAVPAPSAVSSTRSTSRELENSSSCNGSRAHRSHPLPSTTPDPQSADRKLTEDHHSRGGPDDALRTG
jgi:hypothetical protein